MTITVLTKSMGRRSFDSVTSIHDTDDRLVITYFTNYTYLEKIRIPMVDIIGFHYGQLNSTKD